MSPPSSNSPESKHSPSPEDALDGKPVKREVLVDPRGHRASWVAAPCVEMSCEDGGTIPVASQATTDSNGHLSTFSPLHISFAHEAA
jgi:hypothetical protein